jgi:nucleoside triphosphate pyrophosphatase
MLVLASTSPRRYQILALLGLPFLMVPPASREVLSGDRPPAQEALHQAHQKAASLVSRFPDAVILGSDTLINLDRRLIGKPSTLGEARAILQRLRGRSHDVVTAVSILHQSKTVDAVETAKVNMRDFTDTELDAYLATGDPLDKAGAYAIQGAGRELVASLDGDYLAVVGLPLRAVAQGLAKLGCPVTVDVDRLYRERAVFNWRTFEAP